MMFYMIKAKRHFANADVLFSRFFALLRMAIQCISWTLLELQHPAFYNLLMRYCSAVDYVPVEACFR